MPQFWRAPQETPLPAPDACCVRRAAHAVPSRGSGIGPVEHKPGSQGFIAFVQTLLPSEFLTISNTDVRQAREGINTGNSGLR